MRVREWERPAKEDLPKISDISQNKEDCKCEAKCVFKNIANQAFYTSNPTLRFTY